MTLHASTPVLARRWIERVEALLADRPRVLLGLVGPPGAGKSTLALALHQAFAGRSSIVPMDGYHLANTELARLGRSQRKGAPDTFDAGGYVALLRRLRAQRAPEVVYAPEFRREIEEAIAGAIAIEAHTPLLIAEGNYLLLEQGPWAELRGLLDEIWYVDVPDTLRQERLVRRHEAHGRSRDEALAWIARTDEPNAVMVAATRDRAHRSFRWDTA